jgi:hypothetical protein
MIGTHQDQRHQRAGAVPGHAAEDRGKKRDARDQQELIDRNVGEGCGEHCARTVIAIVRREQ